MNYLKPSASILSTAALAMSLSHPLHADVTLDFSSPQNSNENMVLSVIGNRAAVKFVDPSGEQVRMVFDNEQDTMVLVMDSQKQYMDMDAMLAAMGQLSGMLSGLMKDLPDDAKGQLGDLFGGLLGGKDKPAPEPETQAVLTETGASDEIAGYKCAVATLKSKDGTTELCLADPGSVGLSANDFSVMQAMLAKQQESVEQVSSVIAVQNIGFDPSNLDKMPLRIKQISGVNAGSVSELQNVSNEVDAAIMVIPDNYKPMELPGVQ